MKKPIKKNYCTKTWFTEWVNADKKPGEPKVVSFDSKAYAKDAERYIEYLEKKLAKLS